MPPPHPRRVLFLNWRDTSHPQGGGSERYVEQLASWLAAGGDDVIIHCAAHGDAPSHEVRAGVRLYRRGGPATVYAHGLAAIRRHRPDVVVDVENGVPFFSPLAHRRVVLLVHHVSRDMWLAAYGPVLGRLGWLVEAKLVRRFYRRARYVAVSEPTRDDVVALGVEPRRVAVVHNATDPLPVRAVGAGPVTVTAAPTLCVVARLVAHKRVEHAVTVLARLVDEFPGLRLRVVGDGPARAQVHAHATRLGVDERLDLLGWLDEGAKHEAIATSWVLLCPSIKEGWGRVVMEAAAHRVPTVAYRAGGGLRESVRHGVSGLLADDLDEMVTHTRRLLLDPVRRAAMGAAAHAHAASFSPERTVAEFRTALAAAEVGSHAG